MKFVICCLFCSLISCKNKYSINEPLSNRDNVFCTKERKLDLELHNVIDEDISKVKKAEDLLNIYPKYKNCIDGSIAELYSEKVSILLDEQWDVIVSNYNEKIEQALIVGVTGVWEFERSKRILKNATNKCNHGYTKLCKAIIDDANI